MREYEIDVHGVPHTFLLSDAEAERRGLTPKDAAKAKAAPAPSNKARSVENKGA